MDHASRREREPALASRVLVRELQARNRRKRRQIRPGKAGVTPRLCDCVLLRRQPLDYSKTLRLAEEKIISNVCDGAVRTILSINARKVVTFGSDVRSQDLRIVLNLFRCKGGRQSLEDLPP